MKRILLILLCVFLVSCNESKDSSDYFTTPHRLYVTVNCDGISLTGEMSISPEEIVFCPDTPKGLQIKINSEGGEVSFGDLTFGNSVIGYTRIASLYSEMTEGTLTATYDKEGNPETFQGKNITITVHKEICK